MSLPAGFSITSIDGLRCTAVPRSATTLPASLASLPAATPTTTSTSATTTSISSSSIDASPNPAGASPTSTTTAQVASTSIVSTPVASFFTSTSAVVLNASATGAISSASAIPASRKTTPTTSSSTAVAIAQSEVSASPTVLSGNNNGNGFVSPSKPTSSSSSSLASTSLPGESSAASGISSNPQITAAPVVGGVVGSVALVAIVAMIFYFFRKRRRGRESLLTPLTTGRRSSFYEADNASVGPSGRGSRWKSEVGYQTDKLRSVGTGIKAGIVGLGASLKSKVGGDRSDTPSVNLNRGNSQFLDGPIPQHSRNNSVLSQTEKPSIKDRASDWWERFSEKVSFAWRMRMKTKEPEDPFAAARSMTEKQAKMNNPPDFSQLLRMDDRDLQLQAERRRLSLAGNTNSLPQLGSLGLNFSSVGDDPFADPVKGGSGTTGWRPPASTNPAVNPFADPATSRSNPFADPPTRPGATMPKANSYISDIRRSRGQSIDVNTNNVTSMYRPPSTAVGSRYPSTIAPSRDSYRDTVLSSFSANARKGKGRSDPFDLERPELWKSKDTNSTVMYPAALSTKPGTVGQGTGANSRVISSGSFLSKYSSGVSLGEWGDPGPDLGPGSGSSSMRGNASSNGSQDFSAAARGYYGEQQQTGGAKKNWDTTRAKNNVSPLSRTSSKGGVGKAM
ncbi:hypothetical protein EG329_007105 [Mollisiaceae sp. DMI_Dod_QoI]|nr:hypothetical protein EG329_007105 [Helotiales sp. DMI_Dod_QoI]